MIHTEAVCRNSGTPTRLPAKSCGVRMPGIGVDEHKPVAEHSGGECRDGDEGELAPGAKAHVEGKEHLGGIELAVFDHPVDEDGRWLHGYVCEVDVFGLDDAVAQGFSAVVGAAGEGQWQACHLFVPF